MFLGLVGHEGRVSGLSLALYCSDDATELGRKELGSSKFKSWREGL